MPQYASPLREPLYPWPAPAGPFTAADLADLPHDGHRYELIEGSLHMAPPVEIAHHTVADHLVALLAAAAPAGWRPVREVGLDLGDSVLVPDVTVLRPGVSVEAVRVDPVDVALVVEVEAFGSRRLDRSVKLTLYAEAGIETYWRVERTAAGPIAHLYSQVSAGHYRQHRAVNPGESVLAELPYQVQIVPATWLR